MRAHPFTVISALLLSAALAAPGEGAQRQRRPSQSDGGGQQSQGPQRAQPRSGGDRQAPASRAEPQPRSSPPAARSTPTARATPRNERVTPPARTTPSAPSTVAPSDARRRTAVARRGTDEARGTAVRGGSDAVRGGPGATRGGVSTEARGSRPGAAAGRPATPGNAGARVAVPRQGPPPRRDDRFVYAPRGRVNTYYPRSSYYYRYSIGFGPAGRGSFYFDRYYDSYVFHPRTIVRYSSYGTYGYPTGELRLRVRPREAQVFVDGYYAGVVDDFDGTFQALRLEEGPYLIEIVLPGYEPLVFDVRILPGEKVTYRGEMFREY